MGKFLVPSYKEGEKVILRVDNLIVKPVKKAKRRVRIKNFDYVALIAGLPGYGKSTLAQSLAKLCDPYFNVDRIAFDADEFIEITNNCPEFGSVVLDESFASLNSRTTMTEDFIRIINHLQLVRQRHLFIFLCLPNFFDLAKGIAIFRSSHLFVVYTDENDNRGRVLAFGRREKTKLYVKGSKYMDYNCVRANFYGKFWKNEGIIDTKEYEKRKQEHLMNQGSLNNKFSIVKGSRDEIIYKLKTKYDWKSQDLAELSGLKRRMIDLIVKKEDLKAKSKAKYGSVV